MTIEYVQADRKWYRVERKDPPKKKLIRVDPGPWQRPSLTSALIVVGLDAPKTWNRKLLADTIFDIRSQTRELYDVLVYDDGSTQDTQRNVHEIYGYLGATWGRETTGKRGKKVRPEDLEFERSYLRFGVYPELKADLLLFIEQWGWEELDVYEGPFEDHPILGQQPKFMSLAPASTW